MKTRAPVPENEYERILDLSELDLDYSDKLEPLQDLTRLACKVAGTSISMVNLIDTYTQWTVSNFGMPVDQMSREDSVCQYTILSNGSFEVKDLSKDERFRENFYVTGEQSLRYYYGVPLHTSRGRNLGALCVLDREEKTITPEKAELLRMIANEIVSRLMDCRMIQVLRERVDDLAEAKKRVAHDIRGPLGGIISIAEIISDQGNETTMEEILDFMGMISKSAQSLLELTDEILTDHDSEQAEHRSQFTLGLFREKLLHLYHPQAVAKGITLTVAVARGMEDTSIQKNKLLQITGNLVSNAIKFTPAKGAVTVDLNIENRDSGSFMHIRVSDTGTGMNPGEIEEIIRGTASSKEGTGGEKGYGFGLRLVKHLIASLNGELGIHSRPSAGTCFEVLLPR